MHGVFKFSIALVLGFERHRKPDIRPGIMFE